MKQLQQITETFNQLESGSLMVRFWKEGMEKGLVADSVFSICKEIKDNRPWIVAQLGELITQMIEQFDPVKEADEQLQELNELWQQPRDNRNFTAIRSKIHEIETLFKISAIK